VAVGAIGGSPGSSYYALLSDPIDNAVVFLRLKDGTWARNERRPLPAGVSIRTGAPQVSLEANGPRIRVFIYKQFAAEFTDFTLKDGRLGLCVLGQAIAYFDVFELICCRTNR
jgi:hypothetical protein